MPSEGRLQSSVVEARYLIRSRHWARSPCSDADGIEGFLNISGGAGNHSKKEFARFLTYSIRSGYECVGCIDMAGTNDYIAKAKHGELDKEIHEVISMLVGLQQSLD